MRVRWGLAAVCFCLAVASVAAYRLQVSIHLRGDWWLFLRHGGIGVARAYLTGNAASFARTAVTREYGVPLVILVAAWQFATWFCLPPRLTPLLGRCPTCGYDLRGSVGTCPECAAARL